MLGVVPAVFLVNKNMLGDREMPKSWADLLKPEFRKICKFTNIRF